MFHSNRRLNLHIGEIVICFWTNDTVFSFILLSYENLIYRNGPFRRLFSGGLCVRSEAYPGRRDAPKGTQEKAAAAEVCGFRVSAARQPWIRHCPQMGAHCGKPPEMCEYNFKIIASILLFKK